MAVILNAMKEPPYPTKVPVTRQDSLDNYQFYKTHYWDGTTFMDEAVVRTPFFAPKLKRYYTEVIPQASDSIIKDADYKLLLARSAPEMYKYLLNWLTDTYLNPKYMGQDAVFVHLFEKYHSKGLSPWLNEKQMETITRRAYMLMSNLVGEKAANLEMLDTAGKVSALYDLKSDYTVVVFWDPNCGHCKEEIPRIDSIYRASWKDRNVGIYAVMSENDVDAWKKYISTNHLTNWTHVYQSPEMLKANNEMQRPSFRQLYDVTQTPTLYLLDKEKRIVGKKLTLEQMNDLMNVKWSTLKN
jgi:thiol-disulfide isomerase/thioredoxin